MRESIVKQKSYDFALQIVETSRYLVNRREYILSKQLLRSGTAIGALIREAEFGQSKADFVHKLSISLKEANETDYWLSLLHDTGYLSGAEYQDLNNKCQEIIRILAASVKTLKED